MEKYLQNKEPGRGNNLSGCVDLWPMVLSIRLDYNTSRARGGP